MLLLAACGGGGDGGRSIEGVPAEDLVEAAAALCAARDAARRDVMLARATFYDRSHDALHTIARALDDEERALAARLLEDKQRVEADLSGRPVPTDLAADLTQLAESTRAGLAALSLTVPPCA